MTEEQKAALAAAEAQAKAEGEAKGEESEPIGEENPEQKESLQINYEAELAKERERREKAEKAAAELAFKAREAKRKEETPEEEEDEDKPLTARELQNILAKERLTTQKELQRSRAEDRASALAGSDAEKNLVLEIFRSREFPAHLSIEEQVDEAYAIVNRKKLIAQNEELKRALRSKETRGHDIATGIRETGTAPEAKISPQDATAIKAAGYIWDGVKRVYKKPINGGKQHLFFDPKSKQRWSA